MKEKIVGYKLDELIEKLEKIANNTPNESLNVPKSIYTLALEIAEIKHIINLLHVE